MDVLEPTEPAVLDHGLVRRMAPDRDGVLARGGAISRRDGGERVLHGNAPEELRDDMLVAAFS